jgi:uncharacterized protein (TIGR02598 family)
MNPFDTRPVPRARDRACGFSLIEVTIALGIFVFAIVPIIGLTSSGMKNLRDSMDDTVRADIVRKVAGEVMRSPYANVAATNYFFTDEGVRVDPGDAQTIFVAQTTITNAPGLLSTTADIAKLLTVTVRHIADSNNRTVFSQLLINTAQ